MGVRTSNQSIKNTLKKAAGGSAQQTEHKDRYVVGNVEETMKELSPDWYPFRQKREEEEDLIRIASIHTGDIIIIFDKYVAVW